MQCHSDDRGYILLQMILHLSRGFMTIVRLVKSSWELMKPYLTRYFARAAIRNSVPRSRSTKLLLRKIFRNRSTAK